MGLLRIARDDKITTVEEVPIDVNQLSACDSFILDCHETVFQFNGSESSPFEKERANALIDHLEARRHGILKDTIIIDGLHASEDTSVTEFWSHFGGKPEHIHKTLSALNNSIVALYQVSVQSSSTPFLHIASGKQDVAVLNEDKIFLLDGCGKLYMWMGQ